MFTHDHRTNGLLIAIVVCLSSVMLGKCVPDPHPSSIARQYWQEGYTLVEQDNNYAAAIPWYLKAANLGDACGQLSLGFVYANGESCLLVAASCGPGQRSGRVQPRTNV